MYIYFSCYSLNLGYITMQPLQTLYDILSHWFHAYSSTTTVVSWFVHRVVRVSTT